MITEDYVSFEIAKLLKEKGFNEATNRYYNAQYDQIRTVSDTFMWHWNDEWFMKRVFMEGAIAIPTLQMAMKWLRENHNRHISIIHSYILNKYKICITKYNPNNISDLNNTLYFSADYDFSTYEEACEAAIKYCLENLI